MECLVYRKIPDFSGYEVSEYGNVRSIKSGREIAFTLNHAGYKVVTITDDLGYRAPRKVHQLVYTAFVGPLELGKVVDHIDDDKLNNHYSNLQLLTPSENSMKSFISGANKSNVCWRREEVEKMCALMSEGKTNLEIIRLLGIDPSKKDKCIHFLNSLIRGETHRDIASRYEFKKRLSAMNKKDVKLDPSSVENIYMQLLEGSAVRPLSRLYGVSDSTIRKIRDKKTWVDITNNLDCYFE